MKVKNEMTRTIEKKWVWNWKENKLESYEKKDENSSKTNITVQTKHFFNEIKLNLFLMS